MEGGLFHMDVTPLDFLKEKFVAQRRRTGNWVLLL
jgi:hypothetical protein